MQTTVEIIKERLSIVEVINSYLKLEKAGINYKARCPFHNEKTPSFFVSPTRGTFYCFGCSAKGDIFTFIERLEGVDFMGALKILADRAGVPLRLEHGRNKDEKDKLFSIMEKATVYFERNLKNSETAHQYLLKRGLSAKIINRFRVGYAFPEWRSLYNQLVEEGCDEKLIERVGLTKKIEKGYYDRFRSRIMFPISDASGRVIAFSGRIFDELNVVKAEEAAPKYVNSPETPLFFKSKVLYGFDKAKEGIRRWGFTIVVEGQMDLLMAHQAGYTNTVALSGTALTGEQLEIISHFSERLVMAFDADKAGLSAAGKSASLALNLGFDVKVAALKGGKDPADLILANPELWKEAIRTAKHVIDFYLDLISSYGYEERKFRLEVSKQVLPYVAEVKSRVDQAHFVAKISEKLHLPEASIAAELKQVKALIVSGEMPEIQKEVPPSEPLRKDAIIKKLIGILLLSERTGREEIDREKLHINLTEILGEKTLEQILEDAKEEEEIIFEAERAFGGNLSLSREVEDLLLFLKRELLKDDFEKTMEEIKLKEKSEKEPEIRELMEKCHKISKEIASLESKLGSGI